jgi:hypothetical protein
VTCGVQWIPKLKHHYFLVDKEKEILGRRIRLSVYRQYVVGLVVVVDVVGCPCSF